MQAQSIGGSLTFDGAGAFTFSGTQNIGAASNSVISGSGVYTVKPTGFVTFTKPGEPGLTMNGRAGAPLLVASTTEGQSNEFDMLIAIPAPVTTFSNASLNGLYQLATLEFPGGNGAQARSTAFNATANGAGSLGNPSVNGHAVNLGGGATTQTVTGATYTVSPDGSGTASFGTSSASQLVSGTKTIFVSADGQYILGGSTAAGGLDMILGTTALPASSGSSTSISGLYFTNGLAYVSGAGGGPAAYAGSDNSAGNGAFLFHRRYHAPSATIDFTGSSAYAVIADGTGTVGFDRLAVGATGHAFFTASAGDTTTSTYDLNVAIAAPSFSGSSVFVNPVGVVNAASLAPAGSPVAPGEYVSLFGVNLASAPASATTFPIPISLGNVGVKVNGIDAPLNYVSPNQINLLVPFAVTGSTATIVVTNTGTKSNSVDVPLAATAPGIFSQDGTGANLGVILHADFSPVNGASPAKANEVVLIFMTGLGTVNPPLGDGAKPPVSPLSYVNAAFSILIDNQNAPIQFQGLAPGFAGLYQLNVQVPAKVSLGPSIPLAISTNEAFLDQVSIAIH